MSFIIAAEAEPIPGYRLLKRMGGGGFGEVWKCEAPGGLHKAIKFVAGDPEALQLGDHAMEQEKAALGRLRTIRHPFLLSVERIEVVEGGLVVVMELADENLRDVLTWYREEGERGVPRDLLLDFLDETAEALDLLNWQHGLMHLDVKPDNIFLVANHAKLGDFGLVSSLPEEGLPARTGLGGSLTPAYASPEAWSGEMSRQSDQYSLAVTYYELRTGGLPFGGHNARQLMLQHSTQEPNLGLLPAEQRWAVARALAKVPGERFDCCKSFVHALRTGKVPSPSLHARSGKHSTVRRRPAPRTQTSHTLGLEGHLTELITRAAGSAPEAARPRPVLSAGELFRRFVSQSLRGQLQLKLKTFQHFWSAEAAEAGPERFLYRFTLPASFQGRYPLDSPGFEVEVNLFLPATLKGQLMEAEVRVKATGAGEEQARQQLASEVGPLILENVRGTLGLREERRDASRIEWTEPVVVWPILSTGAEVGGPILCRCQDLSLRGVRLISPTKLPSQLLRAQFGAGAGHPAFDALARVVRVFPCEDGFEVAALFMEGAPGRPSEQGTAAPAT
jgi:serine/threonine protein kinase